MEKQALFPVVEMPEFKTKKEKYDKDYKRSMKWDMKTGDFIRDGTYRIVESTGTEAYIVWCYKMVCTERYKCLCYKKELGVEMEAALKEQDEKAVEAAIERTITEALKVNPRTEYVRGFLFDWNSDKVHCSFTVKGVETEEVILNIIV